MSVKKIKSWKDAFMDPGFFNPGDAPESLYVQLFSDGSVDNSLHRFVPPILEAVSDSERHREGYFYLDEVTRENADRVRFVTSREFVWDEFFEELYPRFTSWVFPSFPMPNLDTVVGSAEYGPDSDPGSVSSLRRVTGSIGVAPDVEAVFPSLVRVGSIVSHDDGSSIVCPSLVSVEGEVDCRCSVRCDALESVGTLKCYSDSGTASFASLRECEWLELFCAGISFPSLELVKGQMDFKRSGPVEFPSLRSVSGYIRSAGKGSLSMPVLESVGGMKLSSEDGLDTFDFPVLHTVGDLRPERLSGDLELAGGALCAPSLKGVGGDFEYCHGASADVRLLELVAGNLFLNCGPWTSFALFSGRDGYERKPVVSEGSSDFIFPSLRRVGKDLQAFDGTALKALKLQSVGGEVCAGKDVTLKTAVNFRIGYSISDGPGDMKGRVRPRFEKMGPSL